MSESKAFDLVSYLSDDYLHDTIQPIVAEYIPKLREHMGYTIDEDDEQATLHHIICRVRDIMHRMPHFYNAHATFMMRHGEHDGTPAQIITESLPAGTVIRLHNGLGMTMALAEDTRVNVTRDSWDIEQDFARHYERWKADPTYQAMAKKRSIDYRVDRYARKELEWLLNNLPEELRDAED